MANECLNRSRWLTGCGAAALTIALALAPENHETLNWRAWVNISLSDAHPQDTAEGLEQRVNYLSAALADRLRMLALAQEDATRNNDAVLLANAYLRLGWTHYQQGRYQQAADEAANGLQYEPRNLALHFNRGLAELAMGDEEHARLTYEAGIGIAKQASSDVRKAKLDEATRDLQDLVKQKPELETAAEPILKALQAAR